jgi:tRNA modification GTPase
MNDTITAISTALGIGAISIVRVSGEDAIDIVNEVFKGKNLSKVASHTIHYGHIIDNEEIVDEVLVSVMRAPKTFTTEDIVEINCHGGIATTNKVLELLLTKGCRLAEPGEFTKRAFLNGRIDLIEAEGVMDLINSKTEQASKLALNQVDGKVSNLIKKLRQEILEVLANIEVNKDYPEYEDIEQYTTDKLKDSIYDLKKSISRILNESKNGKLISEGIKVSIIGKPNVGKSSILNKLLGENKAIVTDVEGTTRDIVEGTINLDGLMLNIIDTAGIRETKDIVESIGVNKSIELIETSDLVLFVLNNNEELDKESIDILKKLHNKNYVVIVNKIDLPNKLDLKSIKTDNIVLMSAIENKGIEELKHLIKKIYNMEEINTQDMTYLTSARSISILRKALSSVKDIEKGLLDDMPIDILEIDLKNIWSLLGEIIGETYNDELIDQLFSQFCLGK